MRVETHVHIFNNADFIYYLKSETNSSDRVQLTFYPWSDNVGFLGKLSSKQFIIYFDNSGNLIFGKRNRTYR